MFETVLFYISLIPFCKGNLNHTILQHNQINCADKKLSVSKFVPVQMSYVIDSRNNNAKQKARFIFVLNVYSLFITLFLSLILASISIDDICCIYNSQ